MLYSFVYKTLEVFVLSENELKTVLLSNLSALGLPVNEVDLVFRPYSKTYFGRYYPANKGVARVALYPYEVNGEFMKYGTIVSTGIHELCHHLQYTDSSFVRRKGVMHNQNFWKLYNHYMIKAYRLGIL